MPSEILTRPLTCNPLECDLDWYYKLQDKCKERAPVNERWFSFIRGLSEQPKGESHKFDFLIEHFVDEITGPFNQDISLLIVGKKGKGKSVVAQAISYYSACELAERLGGKWQDYYDPITNMAVILEDEANALMAIQDKYQVKNYDDIGIGWGARNWQDKDNKDKNDVFQINRTDNTIQVFSVPNQFLLDKVPRSLVSHYAEMDQQFFAHGFTTVKIFEPETLFREGKIIQPYLHVDRTKYVLFRAPKPPQDLIDFYNKRRAENKIKAVSKRMDGEEEEAAPKKITVNPKTLEMEVAMLGYSSLVKPILEAGGGKEDLIAALKENGMSKHKATSWVCHPSFKKLYPYK